MNPAKKTPRVLRWGKTRSRKSEDGSRITKNQEPRAKSQTRLLLLLSLKPTARFICPTAERPAATRPAGDGHRLSPRRRLTLPAGRRPEPHYSRRRPAWGRWICYIG